MNLSMNALLLFLLALPILACGGSTQYSSDTPHTTATSALDTSQTEPPPKPAAPGAPGSRSSAASKPKGMWDEIVTDIEEEDEDF